MPLNDARETEAALQAERTLWPRLIALLLKLQSAAATRHCGPCRRRRLADAFALRRQGSVSFDLAWRTALAVREACRPNG